MEATFRYLVHKTELSAGALDVYMDRGPVDREVMPPRSLVIQFDGNRSLAPHAGESVEVTFRFGGEGKGEAH